MPTLDERRGMMVKVKVISSEAETEFWVPDSREEEVRALLWEVSMGAQNTPKNIAEPQVGS